MPNGVKPRAVHLRVEDVAGVAHDVVCGGNPPFTKSAAPIRVEQREIGAINDAIAIEIADAVIVPVDAAHGVAVALIDAAIAGEVGHAVMARPAVGVVGDAFDELRAVIEDGHRGEERVGEMIPSRHLRARPECPDRLKFSPHRDVINVAQDSDHDPTATTAWAIDVPDLQRVPKNWKDRSVAPSCQSVLVQQAIASDLQHHLRLLSTETY